MAVKNIEDVQEGKWVELIAEVFQVWDSEHSSIRQVGLLKDDTGIIKFVSWEKSNKPLLQLGETYRLAHLPVSGYEDMLSVAIVSTSEIERIGQAEIPTV